jgi:hypothetical protein
MVASVPEWHMPSAAFRQNRRTYRTRRVSRSTKLRDFRPFSFKLSLARAMGMALASTLRKPNDFGEFQC